MARRSIKPSLRWYARSSAAREAQLESRVQPPNRQPALGRVPPPVILGGGALGAFSGFSTVWPPLAGQRPGTYIMTQNSNLYLRPFCVSYARCPKCQMTTRKKNEKRRYMIYEIARFRNTICHLADPPQEMIIHLGGGLDPPKEMIIHLGGGSRPPQGDDHLPRGGGGG